MAFGRADHNTHKQGTRGLLAFNKKNDRTNKKQNG